MGRRGRPRKYFSEEEKKQAHKQVCAKYYATHGKVSRQKKREATTSIVIGESLRDGDLENQSTDPEKLPQSTTLSQDQSGPMDLSPLPSTPPSPASTSIPSSSSPPPSVVTLKSNRTKRRKGKSRASYPQAVTTPFQSKTPPRNLPHAYESPLPPSSPPPSSPTLYHQKFLHSSRNHLQILKQSRKISKKKFALTVPKERRRLILVPSDSEQEDNTLPEVSSMGRTWTTESQKKFLQSKVAEFVQAQLHDTLESDFRPKLWTEWFKSYEEVGQPEETATVEEKSDYAQHVVSRKKQLDSWFNNDATSRKKKGVVSDKIVAKIIKSSKAKGSGSRALTNIQKFSTEHYSTLVKPLVDQKLATLSANAPGGKLPKGSHIPIITQTTKEVWDSLDDDSKEKILQESQGKEDNKPLNSDGPKIIRDFPKYLSKIGNELKGTTNWAVSVLVGGWDDEQKQILTHAFHVGENELGLPFCAANPLYQEQVLDPFSDFIANYVKAERLRNPNAHPPVGPPRNGTTSRSPSSASPNSSPPQPTSSSVSPLTSGPGGFIPDPTPASIPTIMTDNNFPLDPSLGTLIPMTTSVPKTTPISASIVTTPTRIPARIPVTTPIIANTPGNLPTYPSIATPGLTTPVSATTVPSPVDYSLFPHNLGPNQPIEEAFVSHVNTLNLGMGSEEIDALEGGGKTAPAKSRGRGGKKKTVAPRPGQKKKVQDDAPKKIAAGKVIKKQATGKENRDPNVRRESTRIRNLPQRFTI
ncbi:hypothetical protein K435DRAFT_879632 [Dendrothele bispora CBS 962.96]|uniref:Uncharacterized protein n=1 Tax=Dendrothele bispora (strain CBS 962.96) TaxID=1314807 RepID=A0A4S8KKR8_DENBC|nr:hypothetical protein K435DRAFT_879632 [Dendrothele bispora CBS 962.96]